MQFKTMTTYHLNPVTIAAEKKDNKCQMLVRTQRNKTLALF